MRLVTFTIGPLVELTDRLITKIHLQGPCLSLREITLNDFETFLIVTIISESGL